MDVCIICKESIEEGGETVTLREKGAESINKASKQRGDKIVAKTGLTVHKACRLDKTNSNRIEYFLRKSGEAAIEPKCLLRSEIRFNFQTDCIFCGKTTESKQLSDRSRVISVRTLEIKKTL